MSTSEFLADLTSHIHPEARRTICAWAVKTGGRLGDAACGAEDLVQDALLFWDKICTAQEDHTGRMQYLNTKLKSYAIDNYRKQGRRAEVAYIATDDDQQTMQVPETYDPLADLELAEQQSTAPEWYRTLLELAEGEHAGRRLSRLSSAKGASYARNLLGKSAGFDIKAEVSRLLGN
jgi:DNA-directed RNA polymerase specialized sigma24 family protein